MSLLKLDLDAVTVQSQKNAQAMTKGGSADGALRLLSTMRTEALFTVHRDSSDSLKKNGRISIDLPFFLQIFFFWLRRCIFEMHFSAISKLSSPLFFERPMAYLNTYSLYNGEKSALDGISFMFFFHIPPTL